MKGGGDPHAARLLAKWIDGLVCQEVTIRTDGEPSICELVRRARELRAQGATTADEVSPPGDSAAYRVAERTTLATGGFVKDVVESPLAGRAAGPRLRPGPQTRAQSVHVGSHREKGRKFDTPLAGCGLRASVAEGTAVEEGEQVQ